MPRNSSWSRDELILALDLYFRLDFAHSSSAITQAHATASYNWNEIESRVAPP